MNTKSEFINNTYPGGPRPATLMARSFTELAEVVDKHLREILRENPDLLEVIIVIPGTENLSQDQILESILLQRLGIPFTYIYPFLMAQAHGVTVQNSSVAYDWINPGTGEVHDVQPDSLLDEFASTLKLLADQEQVVWTDSQGKERRSPSVYGRTPAQAAQDYQLVNTLKTSIAFWRGKLLFAINPFSVAITKYPLRIEVSDLIRDKLYEWKSTNLDYLENLLSKFRKTAGIVTQALIDNDNISQLGLDPNAALMNVSGDYTGLLLQSFNFFDPDTYPSVADLVPPQEAFLAQLVQHEVEPDTFPFSEEEQLESLARSIILELIFTRIKNKASKLKYDPFVVDQVVLSIMDLLQSKIEMGSMPSYVSLLTTEAGMRSLKKTLKELFDLPLQTLVRKFNSEA